MKVIQYGRRYGIAIASHVAVILVWQAYVQFGEVESYIIDTPLATIGALFEDYAWGRDTWVTAQEIFGGFIAAAAFGVTIALLFFWWRWLDAAIMPLFITFNMIPKVALGPLLIVWFKGGIGTNMLLAFLLSFLPILITTMRGLKEVEPDLIDLVRTLRATRWQIFTKIQLPGSLPYVFSGMRVGAVLATAGAIVGEFILSEEGLVYLMTQRQVELDMAGMFMAVIVISMLGTLLYGLVILAERLTVPQDARIESV